MRGEIVLGLALLLLVFAACGGAAAGNQQIAEERITAGETFKFQYTCINRSLDPCIAAEEFAKRVSERTSGRVKFQISSFPELGLAGPDTLRLVGDGTLGLAEIYSGYIGGDLPIVDMDNLWGMYSDYETQLKVTDAIREDIDRIISERSGGVVLGYQFYPSNYYFAKKPLYTAEDIKGLKTRSHSTVLKDLLDGMGADAQFMAFSEVYTGLERGILDAAVTCGTCGSGLRWYEVTDYLVGPIVALSHTWITVNGDRWAELPPDLQAIVREEAKRHEDITRENALTIWDKDGIEENKEAGMEIIEFTPELKKLMREAALTKVLPNWIQRAGGPNSEAARIYNEKVAPILKVEITAEGKAREIQ
jgi:TRAP-type C4-dicarboxylate transport system substrate-binding protein